jgi:hypothetical protein
MKKISFFLSLVLSSFLTVGMLSPSAAQPAGNPGFPSSWSIVASYTIPNKASGLAWDGTYIYFGQYWTTSGQVYKFDPATGNSTLQCTGPFEEAYGLTFKSPNLVTVNQPSSSSQPSQALEFSMSGTQVSTITLPDHYMSGIAYDNGTYWVCTYYPDPGLIYHINASGTVLSSFVPPNTQPWDICLQGTDLWIADYYGNMIYKVTNTGTVLESHASQGATPSGIVFDGTYLWYCDGPLGGNSTLYKVDLSGSGTPAIYVPSPSHDYGTVPVGQSPTWNCAVQNTGTANLVITSVGIPSGVPVSTSFGTPATLTPGQSVNIPFTYAPLTAGPLNTLANIASNDPIHPQTLVTLTGNAVFVSPHIIVPDAAYDWGERRAGAYSGWFMTIINDGSQPLTLSAFNFSDTHFSLDPQVSLPVTIGTLDTATIRFWFHPTEGVVYNGTVSITTNDPTQNPFTVNLAGTGVVTLYPMGTVLWTYQINAGFDNSPKSIVPIDDVTGDGVPDVVISSEDDVLRCFNGNSSVVADVMWSRPIYAGSVYQQNGLATIDDVDGDGYRDVIIGTAWGDESITAYSGKTGTQIWKHDTHEYGDGGWVYQVDVNFDYNNDGFPDVLASTGDDGNGTGPKRVYCLDGKTGGLIWDTPCVGPVFSVIGVEDFNGDGIPDAVAGSSTADETHARVYGINGDNGAIIWTYSPAGSSTWGLMQVEDVNGDNIKDVVSGDFNGNIYLHNAVNGSRITSISITNDMILKLVDMGDVNKDGYRDILVGHSVAQAIILSGLDLSTIWSKSTADKAWNVANVGDVSWDGTNDAGVGTLYSDNYVYFMNGVDGHTMFSNPAGDPVDALAGIPDIVGDQSMELVAGGRSGMVVCLSGGYDSATISVQDRQGLTKDKVLVYPNPCRETLHIGLDMKLNSDVKIRIADITGREEFSQVYRDVSAGPRVITLNRSQFGTTRIKTGIYFVSVETGEGAYHVKVIFD